MAIYGMRRSELDRMPVEDYYALVARIPLHLAPPVLDHLPGDTMLAVAPVPGKILEEWRHADLGVWIAWPHAADASCAEEMTAAQLRDELARRDAR